MVIIVASIRKWLDSIGLGHYAEAFEENAIGWDVLPHLDHDVLKDAGVRAAGDRFRILNAVKLLAAQEGTARASVHSGAPSQASGTGGAERRQLTIMFCDLVGSSE